MSNDQEDQDSINTGEDQTSINDGESGEDVEQRIKTLDAQRKSWRDKAVDPESGKTYKELLAEARNEDKTSKKNDKSDHKQSDEHGLLAKFDKLALKTEGITQEDEVELAQRLKEETGKDMEDLLGSKYFKSELESLRESRANTVAISDVRGGRGKTEAKSTPEYWVAKGTPPTREDVPDRKARATIARAMMANAKDGKKFYND